MPIVTLRKTHKHSGVSTTVSNTVDETFKIKAEKMERSSCGLGAAYVIKADQMKLSGAIGFRPFVREDGCVRVRAAFVDEH